MRVRLMGFAAAMVFGWAAVGAAAPLDYRIISGTLMWPSEFSGERRAVVRGDDGNTYFLETSRTDLDPRPALRAGDRVTFVGREGQDSTQIVDAALDRDSGVLASIPTQPTEPIAPASIASPAAPLPRGWRQFRGAVESAEGSTMTLVSQDGRKMRVNVREIAPDIREELRRGADVLVLGPYANGTLVAQGLVVQK